MMGFIGVLVSIIVGIFGVIFGSSQRKKRKAAEEKSERLAAELELKVQQSQTAAVQEAAHTADLVELVEADNSELATRANSLFGTKTYHYKDFCVNIYCSIYRYLTHSFRIDG